MTSYLLKDWGFRTFPSLNLLKLARNVLFIYRVDHGNRTLFKDMPVTSTTSKNVIAGMDRLAMELYFIHQIFFSSMEFWVSSCDSQKCHFFSIFTILADKINHGTPLIIILALFKIKRHNAKRFQAKSALIDCPLRHTMAWKGSRNCATA